MNGRMTIANPEAAEFEVQDAQVAGTRINGYRVELFPMGSDTASAAPVRAMEEFGGFLTDQLTDQRERLWRKVALAIGATVFLAPFLIR